MELPFEINVEGKTVLGMAHIPYKRAKGNPTIIMFYGFNGERVDNNRLAVIFGRFAEEKGVTFIRFDYRGLGVSEGNFWETTIDTKVRDAKEIINYISTLYHEPFSLFYLGFSDGTRIVTNILDFTNSLSGICLWSPVLFPVVDNVHESVPKRFSREPFTKKLVVPHRGLWVGQQYLRQLSSTDSGYEQIKSFTKPILTIFGNNDPSVVKTMEELYKIKEEEGKKICIEQIPDADHLFSQEKWIDQICKITTNWVCKICDT